MLLAIDAGNTNVVFALVDGGEIRARWRIATDPRRTADEYAVWLHQLLELEGFREGCRRRRDHRHGCPARAPQSRSARQQIFPRRAVDRRAGSRWPGRSTLDVDEPQNVGADRALNAIAAHAKYPGDLIVIDFGTATTFDVVGLVRRLQRRDHRARHQPVARRAGQRRREAPAYRDRGAGERSRRYRPHDREPDADRHLLGLCRDDRRTGRADEARVGRTGHGHRHRRPRRPVRQAHQRVRRD